jgi:hypothetical protein
MNKWGVPDWLRPQDYPAPQGPGAMMQWAWEFLRRNEEFRNFWLTKGELHYRERKEKFGILDSRDPRQNSHIPAFSDTAVSCIEAPALSYERLPDSAEPVGPFGFVRPSRANLSKEVLLENSRLQLSWFAMGVAIDLRFPLDGQLKAIRKLAEEDQLALKKAGRINPKTARTSDRDRYVLYLRILDAESARAKRSIIANELFPDFDNSYPSSRLKAFDNNYAEARRLRDSGYRALALSGAAALN